jgi:hypothetical protein
MDDFRVGPISPYDADRRPEPCGAVKRRPCEIRSLAPASPAYRAEKR